MATGGETSLGGRNRDFPSTCWSRFSGAGDASSLETLARSYWKPIYAYVRARFAKSNDDAKDLTQDFFAWMVESGFLAKADPARGRFRAFVKTSLQNHFFNDERRQRREKRGGGREFFSIGAGDDAPPVVDAANRPPEELLDDAWRHELFTRAAERLERAYRDEGRPEYAELFADFYLRGGEAPAYKDLAARHGVAESNVTNLLTHAKRRFREIITQLVSETVGSEEELRDELRSLFGPDWK